MAEKEILDADDVAQLLNVSIMVVYKMLREGDMPGRKIGREWRIRRVTLDAWLDGRAPAPEDDPSVSTTD